MARRPPMPPITPDDEDMAAGPIPGAQPVMPPLPKRKVAAPKLPPKAAPKAVSRVSAKAPPKAKAKVKKAPPKRKAAPKAKAPIF